MDSTVTYSLAVPAVLLVPLVTAAFIALFRQRRTVQVEELNHLKH